jgi:para-nitrobenzyl esterase
MKIFTLLALTGLISTSANAQCAGGRYESDIFSAVTVTSNVVYGSNTSSSGSLTSLKLDFYEPTGDTETHRPLIVFAHGGSFIGGSKTDADVAALCNRFAKKGYACASIDYRVGFFPFDSVNSVKAVVRAVQDMKGALRFFYMNAATNTGLYKIDTTNIFIGGSSAGAITALHTAYLDQECELYSHLSAATITALGGLDGTSGNAGRSTAVKGVINLCGALAVYKWLEVGDVPFVSLHGTVDAVVGYNRQIVNPGVPLIYLDGSRMLVDQATAVSVANPFYTFRGAPHTPYAGGSVSQMAYMDTVVNFTRDFLIGRLGCSLPPLQLANTPSQTATLYNAIVCGSGGINESATEELFSIYPNPAQNIMTIDAKATISSITMVDVAGKLLLSVNPNSNSYELNQSDFGKGIFFVSITTEKGMVTKKVMFN